MIRRPPRSTLFPTRRSSDLTAPPSTRRGGKIPRARETRGRDEDRKSTRLNSSHLGISYAAFCLKKKRTQHRSLPPAQIASALPGRCIEARPVADHLRAQVQQPVLFFFYWYGDHRDLHSFPTRRSSDLVTISPQMRASIEKGLAATQAALSGAEQTQRSEEHTSELQSLRHLVCSLLL